MSPMKKTTRDTLVSVAVLAAIAFICVCLLSLANEFLKYEATLDAKTAAMLNALAPSGADDQTAFDEGYFKLYSDDELKEMNFSISDFNKGRTVNSGIINAVYGEVKGDGAGSIFIEVASKGYYDMTLIVAFRDKHISGVAAKTLQEDTFSGQIFGDELFEKFLGEVDGKTEAPSESDIKVSTGATTNHSVRGLHTALAAAVEAVNLINEGGDNE